MKLSFTRLRGGGDSSVVAAAAGSCRQPSSSADPQTKAELVVKDERANWPR